MKMKMESDLEFAVDLCDADGGGIFERSDCFPEAVKRCHSRDDRNLGKWLIILAVTGIA